MLKNQSFKIKTLSALLVLGVVWFASSACFPIYTPPRPAEPCPPGAPPNDPCHQLR